MEILGTYEDGMPFVSVRVAGREFRALMDTGFDGYVMLSRADISRLNLREMGKVQYRTADGQIHDGRVYLGRVDWMGSDAEVSVDSTDGDIALIGMKLLEPLRVVMEPSRRLLALSASAAS